MASLFPSPAAAVPVRASSERLRLKETQLEYLWPLGKVQALSIEAKPLPSPPVSLPGFTLAVLIMYQQQPSLPGPGPGVSHLEDSSQNLQSNVSSSRKPSDCLRPKDAPCSLPSFRDHVNAGPWIRPHRKPVSFLSSPSSVPDSSSSETTPSWFHELYC